LHVTFEEGTWADWLYDLLMPHVTKIVACDPRRNAPQFYSAMDSTTNCEHICFSSIGSQRRSCASELRCHTSPRKL
jgi:hypothetical protein